MKTSIKIFSFLIAVMLVTTGCGIISNINARTITPSNVIITETRDVSGFTSINMGTLGKVILSQGNSESLTISGSDNLVPLVKTTVSNGTLTIQTDENINVTSFNNDNLLTFTIGVKDLSSLTVSGLGDVRMETLSTPKMDLTMSGAGKVQLNQLTADSLNITVSGLGSVDIAGEVSQATINLPGAGTVNAPDLKIKTANVTIPGLGNATLWVTDQLTGTISGAGTISYYGNPQTNVNTTGLGSYKSLGNK
jgi:hypothetical protein